MEYGRSHFGIINQVLNDNATKKQFNWGIVRILGELHILSRASYFMLILVPLLVGLWPTVTTVVNQYNHLLRTTTEKFELASEKINWYQENLPNSSSTNQITTTLSSLNTSINTVKSELEKQSIERSALPIVWALSFLASLLTVIAQIIYQTFAPNLIRGSSIKEYIVSAIDDELKFQDKSSKIEEKQITNLIESSANDYHSASISNIRAAYTSLGFYVSAILVIAYITADQSYKVFIATGWF